MLVTWWSGTLNHLNGDRFEGGSPEVMQFDTQNLTPVAFALLAMALGIAMGALFRRSLPAIAATVGGYVAVRLLVALYLRPSYLHATSTVGAASARAGIPPGSWTLSSNLIDPARHAVTGSLLIPPGCGSVDRGAVDACLGRLGYRTVRDVPAAATGRSSGTRAASSSRSPQPSWPSASSTRCVATRRPVTAIRR